MKYGAKHLLMLVVLGGLCVGVAPNPQDSTETNLQLWGGGGRYAFDGCTETKETSFRELSVSYDHKESSSPARKGVRAAYITESIEGISSGGFLETTQPTKHFSFGRKVWVINPFVTTEQKYVGVGAGIGFAFRTHSWTDSAMSFDSGTWNTPVTLNLYFRLGNVRWLYADLSVMDAVLLQSGGYARLGVGSN